MALAETLTLHTFPSMTARTFCMLALNLRFVMPVILRPTPPRYLALPRRQMFFPLLLPSPPPPTRPQIQTNPPPFPRRRDLSHRDGDPLIHATPPVSPQLYVAGTSPPFSRPRHLSHRDGNPYIPPRWLHKTARLRRSPNPYVLICALDVRVEIPTLRTRAHQSLVLILGNLQILINTAGIKLYLE